MNSIEHKSAVVSVAAFTDVGRVRKNNQDYVAYHIPPDSRVREQYGSLFLVCDGVGGQSAGDVASEHAGRRILNDYYQGPADQPLPTRLLAAIQQANADILAENAEQPDARKMTTTVVAAVVAGFHLHVAHVGDSRAYLARQGQITQLTKDHSWVAEMVRAGDLTPEEARNHPWRNRITRALGLKEHVEVDVQSFEIAPGDVVVLCSDGLTRHVDDQEIAGMATSRPARSAAQSLVKLAKERGGTDNISVIVVQMQAAEAAQPDDALITQRPSREVGSTRRPSVLLPLLIALGALLLGVAGVLIYTQTDLLHGRDSGTPTPATPSVIGSATPGVPIGTVPAGGPVATDTATSTLTTTVTASPPNPTSTARVTSTSTPTWLATRTPALTSPTPGAEPATPSSQATSPARSTLTAIVTRIPTTVVPTALAPTRTPAPPKPPSPPTVIIPSPLPTP